MKRLLNQEGYQVQEGQTVLSALCYVRSNNLNLEVGGEDGKWPVKSLMKKN